MVWSWQGCTYYNTPGVNTAKGVNICNSVLVVPFSVMVVIVNSVHYILDIEVGSILQFEILDFCIYKLEGYQLF